MKENESNNLTASQIKAANLQEKIKLSDELRHLLKPLDVMPEALDLRALRSVNAIFEAITKMTEEKKKLLEKASKIKFTVTAVADKAGLERETVAKNRLLNKIIECYSPDEKEKTAFSELERENQELNLVIQDYQRKERYGNAFNTKIRIAKLESENYDLIRQANIESAARKQREDYIAKIEAENRSLQETINLMSPAVQVQLQSPEFNVDTEKIKSRN